MVSADDRDDGKNWSFFFSSIYFKKCKLTAEHLPVNEFRDTSSSQDAYIC